MNMFVDVFVSVGVAVYVCLRVLFDYVSASLPIACFYYQFDDCNCYFGKWRHSRELSK